MSATVRDHLRLVAFAHTIFALPFALQGAWIAERGLPPWRKLAWIVLCAAAARTAAMGFNRLVDREFDARNPRTATRELPAGRLGVGAVRALVVVAAAVFVAGAFALNRTCGLLALPVLAVLLGYSYVKRFSSLAHLVLGVALGLAPPAAWLAIYGRIGAAAWPVIVLGLAVVTWVFGFDLIYAAQDAEFDRRVGLHSIPARRGVAFALTLSSALHVGTVLLLVTFAVLARLSWIYGLALAGAAALLVWQHRLVRPDDLSRVDRAFFTLNGWVAVALFVGLVLDLALLDT